MLTEAEILQFINEDRTSTKKRNAEEGQRYYDAEHDILNYRMFYFNADGKLVEDKNRSNIRIPHPFFTELVDQEVQYMLSGKDGYIFSDDPDLQQALDEYFDDDFTAELADVMTGAVIKGFEYMYAYRSANDRFAFQHADGMGVVEVRAKDTDDGCEYVIFWYVDRIAKDNTQIKRIQVWDSRQTYFYVQKGSGQLEKDTSEKLNPRPHVTYKKPGEEAIYYDDFGFIPFFRLDNNKKQVSSLKPIKGLIDDYDIMSCSLSNNLVDFDHPLHVVKGFRGDNLDELSQNLKTKKMIGVDADGGVEVHTVDVPYQARLTKMQEDEKNIYRFGMGFNSAQLGDGNVTNVVIRSRYALLDLKCNKLETRLRQFLGRILRVVIDEINRKTDSAYDLSDVYIKFTREVMTNALDNATIEKTKAETRQIEINTILSIANVIDDDTVIRQVCDVLDLDYDEIKDGAVTDPAPATQAALDLLGQVIPSE